MGFQMLNRASNRRVGRAGMERLRRLLAVCGSVTVHVVAAKVVVEQADLLPAILNADQQQHRVALDRPPRTAETNDHPIGKRPLDALLVWHPVRLSDAWDGTLGQPTATPRDERGSGDRWAARASAERHGGTHAPAGVEAHSLTAGVVVPYFFFLLRAFFLRVCFLR